MKLVQWHLSVGIQGADRTGEVEVEDNATHDEIEEAVREDVFNFVEWSWSDETTPVTPHDGKVAP